jgi:signal peptidase II
MRKKVLILSGIIALIDQIVKIFASANLVGNGSIPIIKNFFYLTYVENMGAAWGIFSGNRYFLIIIAILAIYGIVKYFLLDVNITKIEFAAYGLILGGIIGNLIDRILYGFVIDYADFRFGNYFFPVFNIADSVIVIGVGLVIFHLIRTAVEQRRIK